MTEQNKLIDLWPTLDISGKREVVLSVGYDMIEKYGVTRELQTIEFDEFNKNNNRYLASTILHSNKRTLTIYERPSGYVNIWNNPFFVLHSVPHEIGHIYQARIEEYDVYYDDKAFFAACGEKVDMEIFCEIIAISIMNEYFKLHEMKSPYVDEYLHKCLVESIGNLREQYENDLFLLSNSKIDEKFDGIISKSKRLLIDPYFYNLKN